jgi:large subunit ribosomal protein L28
MIQQADGWSVFAPDGRSGHERFHKAHTERAGSRFKGLRQHETTHWVWSKAMAQVCDVCGKGPQFGNNISHAHNVTKRRWNVNLQAVKALVNGSPKKIRVCTSCIKSGKIAKA